MTPQGEEQTGNSIWLLEYRTRERKNGRWSEWQSNDVTGRPASAFRQYPSHLVVSEPKYESRAVVFVRVE